MNPFVLNKVIGINLRCLLDISILLPFQGCVFVSLKPFLLRFFLSTLAFITQRGVPPRSGGGRGAGVPGRP